MSKCYLRDANRHPVTLIAYEIVGGVIHYGISTRHPKDKQDKKLGHHIAEARMKSRKARTVFQRRADPIIDIATDILATAVRTKREDTRWAKAAAEYFGTVTPEGLKLVDNSPTVDQEEAVAQA